MEDVRGRSLIEYAVGTERYSQKAVAECVNIVPDGRVFPESFPDRVIDTLRLSFDQSASVCSCKE
jgi:hypothetical protein